MRRNYATTAVAFFVATVLMLAATSKTSYADSLNNTSNAIHLDKGGVSKIAIYSIQAGGQDGCNILTGQFATFEVTGLDGSGVTASPSQLTFTSCDQSFDISFSAASDAPDHNGPYKVELQQIDGTTIDNTNPANMNIFVNNSSHGNNNGGGNGGGPPPDTQAPHVIGTPDREPNENGWYNAPVTITWSANEPATCDEPTVYEGPDGADIMLTGSCTDLAGNIGTGSVTINYDATAPTITHTVDPASPNINGWYNQDVTVTFEATDATSGIDGSSSSTTVLSEGPNQSASATFTDLAGNSVSDEVTGINVDETAPIVTTTRTPEPNSNGWNNVDVTVTFDATDNLSGLDGDTTYSETVITEGANQFVTHTFTDLAGNTFEASENNINIDKTAPTVTHSLNPTAPNGNGWFNQNVVVTFTATDGLSGIDGLNTQATTLSNNAAGQSASATFTDLAGNSASDSATDINIDKVAPTITQTIFNVVMHQSVSNYAICFDSLSGIASCLVSAFTVNSGVGSTATSPAVVATDNADNTNSQALNFNVVAYSCIDGNSGFKSPVPNTQYKLGRDLPLKFVACDPQGNPVNGVVANAQYKLSTATSWTNAVSGSSSTTGNLFRYDPSAGQYIFNMVTNGLQTGKGYDIRAVLDSEQVITTTVTFTK